MAAGDLSWDELNDLSMTELRKIMVYLNLPYDAKTKKNDLVLTIWASIPRDSGVGETGDPLPHKMSVRLERIYRSLGRLP